MLKLLNKITLNATLWGSSGQRSYLGIVGYITKKEKRKSVLEESQTWLYRTILHGWIGAHGSVLLFSFLHLIFMFKNDLCMFLLIFAV